MIYWILLGVIGFVCTAMAAWFFTDSLAATFFTVLSVAAIVLFLYIIISAHDRMYLTKSPCIWLGEQDTRWAQYYNVKVQPNGSCSFTRKEQ